MRVYVRHTQGPILHAMPSRCAVDRYNYYLTPGKNTLFPCEMTVFFNAFPVLYYSALKPNLLMCLNQDETGLS